MNQASRTKSARRAAPRLSRASASVFANLAKKTKFADPSLADHWPTIAGKEIAALCRPGRITGPPAGRTLEIVAPSGAAAAQLQMHADALKTRVNCYLGPNGVARIVIRQAARQPAPEPEITAAEDNPSPLGQALSSFRAAVKRRNGGK